MFISLETQGVEVHDIKLFEEADSNGTNSCHQQ